jgi:hypothetical protein
MIRAVQIGLMAIATMGVCVSSASATTTQAGRLPVEGVTMALQANTHRASAARVIHSLCKSHQHIITRSGIGTHFIIRNDNYGGMRECLTNRNDWSNFTVTRSSAGGGNGEPVAYPDIFLGCSWGLCSPHSGLPRQVDRLRSLVTTWHTVQNAPGQWSVGYDIWFNRTHRVSGQDDGAELMIWLNSKGFSPNRWPVVMVDHIAWHLAHWVTGPAGRRWNYVQFRRVHATTHVERLNVQPFIRMAERYGFVRRTWWMTSVEAGFEIWHGGAGLGTTSFWARA